MSDGCPAGASRRQFLTRAGRATAAATLAAAAASSLPAVARAATAPPSAAELFGRALSLEQLAAFSLGYVAHHFALSPHGRRVLRGLVVHEHAHERRLVRQLALLPGGAVAAAPLTPADLATADRMLGALKIGRLADQADTKHALELLLRLEYRLEGAYYKVVKDVPDAGLAVLAAEIMAVEAQHVVLLRRLHQPDYLPGAVPDAFVVGPA